MVVEGGIEGRHRALKAIGQLCSTKHIGLVAGKEDLSGGTYKVTNESLKDGLYRLDFACLF